MGSLNVQTSYRKIDQAAAAIIRVIYQPNGTEETDVRPDGVRPWEIQSQVAR